MLEPVFSLTRSLNAQLNKGGKSKENPSVKHFALSFKLLSMVIVVILVHDLPSDGDLCVQDQLLKQPARRQHHLLF